MRIKKFGIKKFGVCRFLFCIMFFFLQIAVVNAQINPTLVYSKEEADAYYPMNHAFTVDFSEYESSPNGYIDKYVQSMPLEQRLCVDKVIVNIPDKTSWQFMLDGFPNLKQIWFGENSCPAFILRAFVDNDDNFQFNPSSRAALTRQCAVYLSADKYPKGLYGMQQMEKNNIFWRAGIPVQLFKFKTLIYNGDMYAAYENGGAGCKSYCPGHKFTAKIAAAHTVMTYTTCQSACRFYYSCAYCGECERNPEHSFVFKDSDGDDAPTAQHAHAYRVRDLSAKNYVGVNFKGEKVYMLSCIWCGINEREAVDNITQQQVDAMFGKGNMPLANYKEQLFKAFDGSYKTKALAEITSGNVLDPRYFAVPNDDDHGAKTSVAAESATRWAMVHGLIDKEVMGGDYLKDVTRLQMASLAVRLAEQLTNRNIKPAASGVFSDTNNEYALKAVSAGIIKASGKTFAPDMAVSRQEMATFLFRALQYVVNNSDIRYSIYTPDLESFTDRGEIAGWAEDAVGFIYGLGIMESQSKTTLKPLENCKIEEAVVAAQRCFYADQVGWYQCISPSERGYAGSPGGWSEKYCTDYPARNNRNHRAYVSYDNGDRIWVNDFRFLTGWFKRGPLAESLPFIDEFSGNILYASGQDFLPVKDNYDEAPDNNAYKQQVAQQKPQSLLDELVAVAKASPNGIAQNILLAVQMAADQMSEAEIRQMINQIKQMDAMMAANNASVQQQPLQQVAQVMKAEAASGKSDHKEVVTEECYGMLNGHQWVDLGLPSGVKWASCNVGASEPEQPGKLYAWGELETKTTYTEANSKTHNKQLGDISGNPQYDVATAKWGKGWRMPTEAEFKELLEYCNRYYTSYQGCWGMMLTSKINQQSIFFPSGGSIEGSKPVNSKTNGQYMTSTPGEDSLNSVCGWVFRTGNVNHMGGFYRYGGRSVRPVKD